MTPQVLEGSWEDILRHADALTGRHVTLTVWPDTTPAAPNEGMLTALREIAQRQQGQRHTSGEHTQTLLRQARAGGMYGLEPADDE